MLTLTRRVVRRNVRYSRAVGYLLRYRAQSVQVEPGRARPSPKFLDCCLRNNMLRAGLLRKAQNKACRSRPAFRASVVEILAIKGKGE